MICCFSLLVLPMEVEVAWMCESNLDKCRYLAEAFKDVTHIFTDADEVATGCAWEFRTGRRLLVPMDPFS